MKNRTQLTPSDDLWRRIREFPIGGESADWESSAPSGGLTFSQRLARENDWDLAHARRCIDEYRRFVYLAATAGPVTPSDSVDQVWHQHLVYTENYWTDLCGEVLPGPLHHGPTRGGSTERVRYQDQYERTLESYERVFGSPPTDVWPATDERFRQSIAAVRIDRRDFWLLRKPRFDHWIGQRSHLTIAGLAIVPLASVFPFNLDATSFLVLYALMTMASFAFAWIWFQISNGWTNDESAHPSAKQSLGWGQLAMLTSGKKRLLQTALVALQNRGVIQCDQHGFSMGDPFASATQPDDDPIATATMQAVVEHLQGSKQPQTLDQLMIRVSATAAKAETQLRESGFLRGAKQRNQFARGILPVAVALLALGAIRCFQGIQNDRPIGLLVVGMLIALVGWMVVYVVGNRQRLTRVGQAAQDRSGLKFSQSKMKSSSHDSSWDDNALPYFAFWGPMAADHYLNQPSTLWTNDLLYGEEIRAMEQAAASGRSGGMASFFDGSGSSGGGDAGCGGGCGGCGGCGG